jgi:membrane protein
VIEFSRFGGWIRVLTRFVGYCLRRFAADDGLRAAAALSYSTLLALVPLIAIVFAVLSAVDAFEGLGAELQDLLLTAMLPEAAQAVSGQIAAFAANASRLTGPGILGLAATAVLLLNTITGAFGAIWHATEPRPLAMRLLVYWALLTLGPLLLGASISVSSYAFAAVRWTAIESYAVPLFGLLPFLLSAAGCTLLFIVVPNRAVRMHHALTGGVVAAVLLELLKKGFGYYLANFPTYQAIYGALAAVPIFLVWMYLSWSVLLLGAEIAATLPEWRAAEARRQGRHGPGARLALALTLLSRLRAASREGRVLKERILARHLPATLGELDQVLGALRRCGYAVRSGGSRWVLGRDLETVSLGDLIRALGLALAPGEGWPAGIAQVIDNLAQAGGEPCRRSLAEVLGQVARDTDGKSPPEAPLYAVD